MKRDIKEHVLTKINVSTLEKILEIDNEVEKDNITASSIIKLITNYKKFSDINVKFSVVCDGELENTINLLMNYSSNINYIYTNKHNLGVYIYLSSILNDEDDILVEENNLNTKNLLDNVVLSGSKDFTLDYSEKLKDKNIIVYN